MNLTELEQKVYDEGLIVEDYHLPDRIKGLIYENHIALQKGMTSKERLCVLAEEYAHHVISYGNILNTRIENNSFQEAKARRYAYDMLLGKEIVEKEIKSGKSSIYELSEALELPGEFVSAALKNYGVI